MQTLDARPWLVATEATRHHLAAPVALRFDPTRVESEAFLTHLDRLDEHLYGERGLTLPRWAFYDCAAMTGVVLGLAARASELPDAVRAIFGAPRDDELLPVSMLLAVPSFEPGHWVAHTLASIGEDLDVRGAHELAERTLELGLEVLEPRTLTAVTQWSSPRLALHAKRGPLSILAAWLPMHDEPASVAFDHSPSPAARVVANRSVDVDDHAALMELQRNIESGGRAWMVEAPSRGRALLRVDPGDTPPEPTAAPHDQGPLRGEVARLEVLRPFVVATRAHQAALDLTPLGRPIAPAHRFDPTSWRSAPFLSRLERLDRLAFGPEGMPMPRWLFFDGAELPGAIIGLGIAIEALDEDQRRRLEIADEEEGLFPLAMYIAIPMLEPGAWFGHNLASIGRNLPHTALRGLGSLTKAVGLAALRCDAQLGATQWDSAALHVHARMGPLQLITAWTPAHSDPCTLTYRARVDGAALDGLVRGRAETGRAERWIRSDDHAELRELQAAIERGERWAIVGPPEADGNAARVPLARQVPLAQT